MQMDPFIEVDLGVEMPISRIFIYNRVDSFPSRAMGAEVQLRDGMGNVQRTAQLTVTQDVYVLAPSTIPIPSVPGRYVRLSMASAMHTLNFLELEVFGSSNTNLALSKAVTMSLEQAGFPGTNLVDGMTGGVNYASTQSGTNPFMMVDLGSVMPISRIVVWDRTDCCQTRSMGARVEILDGAQVSVWQDFITTTAPSYTLNPPTVTPTPARECGSVAWHQHLHAADA